MNPTIVSETITNNESSLELLFSTLAIIISLIALSVTIFHFRKSNRKKIITELLNEYRSEKMGSYIKDLWDLYNEKEDQKILIERYVDQYHADKNMVSKNNDLHITLHLKRRYVSHYFQQIALYLNYNMIAEKLLIKFWEKSTLDTIKQILEPLERFAMPLIIKNHKVNERTQMMINMYNRLYPEKKRCSLFEFYKKIKRCIFYSN